MAQKAEHLKKWIGEKRVKYVEESGEKTPGGTPILKVTYEDGSIEHLSDLMYQKVAAEKSCDLSELRNKRCRPVVELILVAMREWGVKLGELAYISALLNASLEDNRRQAFNGLLGEWMPRPLDPEEADMVTIDRILKRHGQRRS